MTLRELAMAVNVGMSGEDPAEKIHPAFDQPPAPEEGRVGWGGLDFTD